MLEVTLNGQRRQFAEGTTLLSACRQHGIEVPTLCHDDRLHPSGACRLCAVEVKGWNRFATACNTALADGMEIETHSPAVEEVRRTLLELLAHDYPADAVERRPEKQFHLWLRAYGIRPAAEDPVPLSGSPASPPVFKDSTHPYLYADFSRCITCHRCVRICDEVQGQFVWRAWHRGDATRIRPGTAPTLLGSECVSCGACVDTCPTGALEDQSVLAHGPADHWTRTICPYCGTGCEMLVGTSRDRIVQVKPAPDAPVNKGHLCVKGRYAFDFTHAADRITEPMIRDRVGQASRLPEPGVAPATEGAGGTPAPLSGWRKVPWPEAIQFVAEHLGRILAQSGPDSIGLLGSARGTNEENYLAQKFARVVLGTNNVDCCARVCHAPTAAGMKQMLGTGAATNSFDDIERAGMFLVCGCNPTENHPIVGARIKQAVLRGARLVVIDPRAIELASFADAHLPLRPGTNVPLLNALAHVIVTEGRVDEKALRERVRDFDAYREFIAAWTPERAAGITGVSGDLIRHAARLYAGTKPAMCFHGLGMTEQVQGTEGVMCLVNLALLTGNIGKTGAGVNPLRGQNNVQGAAHMGCEPGSLPGSIPLGEGRDLAGTVWGKPVPRTAGLNLMQMMDAAADNKLKALWAIGYDVALTNPNAAATRASLARLDLVIVQDLFLNELAREFGHVFLPACSSFEKDGTFMNSERRVQRVRQALRPAGNSKSDWEILCAVAKAMQGDPPNGAVVTSQEKDAAAPGTVRPTLPLGGSPNGTGGSPVPPMSFDFQSAEEIWNEIRRVWKAGAGISYARLEQGGLQWPCPSEDHPGTTLLHSERFPHGVQASLQQVDFSATPEKVTDEFPFLLITGRTLHQFNAGTMTLRTPSRRLRGTDTLDLAPADAARIGLRDGQKVRVRSRHGAAVMPARIDPRVKPGELFATFHAAEVFLNHLTSPHRDHVVMTPEYKIVAVTLEKVE